ncbi:YcjF family protein [Desulfonatronum thiodismutans]|uniref:YcjF family protein n=1 Tax=Desulfonatronum thiodismutans TaxID=159290 RepID=UPI0004ABED42|nr:DUF533 domain-containing protein [Desulfonatronum thiodismutans]
MTEHEQQAILTICLMAAFADGKKDEREREQIKRIAEGLGEETRINISSLYQDVLLKRRTLDDAVADLSTPEARQLAYEMAVCVCDADGVNTEAEVAFLERLRSALGLDAQAATAFASEAAEIAEYSFETETEPLPAVADKPRANTAELDKMILNTAILNGALELLPQSLSSMAILPLQMKMVYKVGKAYGFELDRGHIKDFAATLGIGLTGQYVEQMGRKLLGGILKKVGGGLLGGLGSAATGSAFSFATTYALGQVAKEYYASGRSISMDQLKQIFSSLLEQGKAMQSNYAGEIQQRASTVDTRQIAGLIRGA